MTWPYPSTHPTTNPLTKLHTHSWVGNSLQISNLQMELKYLDKLKCYQILSDSGGPPPWGMADGWMGVGIGMGVWGVSHAHMHAHTRMHMHVKHVVNMINMDASMSAAICNFFTCINVRVCVCVHACACACVGGYPHAPRCPPLTCPLPRAAGSQKHQNSISPELIKIIRFCLKILYLWTFLNSYRL